MMTLFVLMPFIALFMMINIIIGCYVFIHLGYGPPNWQTAFNQVVRLTTFQYYLNEGRQWLEKKAPWVDKLFTRLHVPKPIIFIDVTVVKEEAELSEENGEDKTDCNDDDAKNEVANETVDGVTGMLVDNLLNSANLPTPVPAQVDS